MKKILIADDEKFILDVLADTLREYGYDVVTAMDANQVMMQAVRENPALIILDITMPAGGGITAYERIRNSAKTRLIPIIFLTASPIENLRGKISVINRDRFINKPWRNDILLAAIKEVLEKKPENVDFPDIG